MIMNINSKSAKLVSINPELKQYRNVIEHIKNYEE